MRKPGRRRTDRRRGSRRSVDRRGRRAPRKPPHRAGRPAPISAPCAHWAADRRPESRSRRRFAPRQYRPSPERRGRPGGADFAGGLDLVALVEHVDAVRHAVQERVAHGGDLVERLGEGRASASHSRGCLWPRRWRCTGRGIEERQLTEVVARGARPRDLLAAAAHDRGAVCDDEEAFAAFSLAHN